MTVIACLHTADSNIAVFDAALAGLGVPGVRLRHRVHAGLLAAAEAAGGLTPGVEAETRAALRGLAAGADAVLLTCSTLGPAAEGGGGAVLRVDGALAQAAVRGGGRVVALCAVASTLEPTLRLFQAAARGTGAEAEVRLVPGAWNLFKRGDRDGYLRLVARAADAAAAEGARVALAQASHGGRGGPGGVPAGDQPGGGLAGGGGGCGRPGAWCRVTRAGAGGRNPRTLGGFGTDTS